MVSVRLENVSKRFGNVVALQDVSLEIRRGELFFFLGPSGCGKTTLLRIIAGLAEMASGEVFFDDRPVSRVPAYKRNAGMVFQNYALWPHMTVWQNVAYGLEVREVKGPQKKARVGRALETVRMAEYTHRRPHQLSGGQQQRVALARALVVEPDVVLLDEPLSNLDAKLRLEMRAEIVRIHRETGITTLYVTHDQKEALSMAERIAIMRDGRVEQIGTAHELYNSPSSQFVAEFVGEASSFEGSVASISGDGARIITALGPLEARLQWKVSEGDKVTCSVRPEAVTIGCKGPNAYGGQVESVTYLGEVEQYVIKAEGAVRIRATRLNSPDPLAVGSSVEFGFAPDSVLVFPRTP